MHEKIVFFKVLEWPKWTDCTDFFKFDQNIARNVQLMFQIVRIFRIFSQQKTFFFDFDWTKANFCMKIFFKKSRQIEVQLIYFNPNYIGLNILQKCSFENILQKYMTSHNTNFAVWVFGTEGTIFVWFLQSRCHWNAKKK